MPGRKWICRFSFGLGKSRPFNKLLFSRLESYLSKQTFSVSGHSSVSTSNPIVMYSKADSVEGLCWIHLRLVRRHNHLMHRYYHPTACIFLFHEHGWKCTRSPLHFGLCSQRWLGGGLWYNESICGIRARTVLLKPSFCAPLLSLKSNSWMFYKKWFCSLWKCNENPPQIIGVVESKKVCTTAVCMCCCRVFGIMAYMFYHP